MMIYGNFSLLVTFDLDMNDLDLEIEGQYYSSIESPFYLGSGKDFSDKSRRFLRIQVKTSKKSFIFIKTLALSDL